MTIKVDVIIPCYNRAETIERAVVSVFNQTYPHFNLYVVDDGSTDNTGDIISSYLKHDHFHYMKQTNLGVSAARNLGIRNSHSPWVAFLDSDDEWLPNKLEAQMKYIQQNPGQRFVHSNELWIRNGVRVNPKVKFDKSNNDLFRRSLEMCLISPSTTMIERTLLLENGLFDESFDICEDYDLWLKILAKMEVGFITDHLVKKYGGHEDQLSTKFPAMDLWRIRSLIKLLEAGVLSTEKDQQIRAEIAKKAEILTQGLIKHKQIDQLNKLQEMLNRIKR